MAKAKYYYNSDTLKYEPVKTNSWKRFLRITGFVCCSLVLSIIFLYGGFLLIDSPKEKQLKREVKQLTLQYEIMQDRMDKVNTVLGDMQERDDYIYRSIFKVDPISSDIRKGGYGGINRYENLKNFRNSEIMIESAEKLDHIARTLYVQSASFNELSKVAKTKTDMMENIPAIQPINGKYLQHAVSGFGLRIHPIYKIKRRHTGIDLPSPIGTPIYATGNGKVTESGVERGYGIMLKIDHGYGYQTLYGHMSRYVVRRGQKVKRGQLIGYVGNTGSSTGPHLHYEVIKNKRPINPINFFYNDLSPSEYVSMVKAASQFNQSFD